MKMTMRVMFVLAFVTCAFCSGAFAATRTVDGSLSDWGITYNAATGDNIGYFNTKTPTTSWYWREDNTSDAFPSRYVGPAWSTKNSVDGEALYFDYDSTNIYVAIVTGLNPFIEDVSVGDLFFDTGKYQHSTNYVTTDIGYYQPWNAGLTHTGHADHEYEYAFHEYNIVSSSPSSVIGPLAQSDLKLYQLDEFTFDSTYPKDSDPTGPDFGIVKADGTGTKGTGEPTALLGSMEDANGNLIYDSLRYGQWYQTQSALCDPWIVNYTNYMKWAQAISVDGYYYNPDHPAADQFGIDTSTVHDITPLGLQFAVQQLGQSHFVYEFALPKTAIGWSEANPLWIHWASECGNDPIDFIYNVVPEPMTVSLLGLGLLGLAGFKARRKTRIG